jgi:hypothetical protein
MTSAATAKRLSTAASEFDGFHSLTVTDNSGANQRLYIADDASELLRMDAYELPPPGPEGVFDVRFSSRKMVEVYSSTQTQPWERVVEIRSAVYPVTVSWEVRTTGERRFVLSDAITGRLLTPQALSPRGKLEITNPSVNRLLISSETGVMPKEFALLQNYPNPFNPTTELKFGLPVVANVSIEIYNLLGQRVRRLLGEERPAGYHIVEWDGSNDAGQSLAGGAYFVRLSAAANGGTSFTQTRKLVMVK